MVLPAAMVVVATTRGAVRVHRGVQGDDGRKLAMGAVGFLLALNLVDKHLLHPAETERKLARQRAAERS